MTFAPSSRTACAVIGCRRTTPKDGIWLEWMCPKHWPTVDRRVRWMMSRIKRRAKRSGWTPSLVILEKRVWARAKRQATEAAVGLR